MGHANGNGVGDLIDRLRSELEPVVFGLALALTSEEGFTTRPFTFARWQEACESAGLDGGAARLAAFLELPAEVQDVLWADLADRVRRQRDENGADR
jgi:hypothetical protein